MTRVAAGHGKMKETHNLELTPEIVDRLKEVRCLALDVDGVLTDGRLVYLEDGFVTTSGFNVHDGLGIRAALDGGLKVIAVSGNATEAVRRRVEHLQMTAHWLGLGRKDKAMLEASQQLGIPLSQFAYMGDDLNDLAPLKMVGLPVAVAQAVPEVKQLAAIVTQKTGGSGAVRELIELILRTQGLWEATVNRFLETIDSAIVQ